MYNGNRINKVKSYFIQDKQQALPDKQTDLLDIE